MIASVQPEPNLLEIKKEESYSDVCNENQVKDEKSEPTESGNFREIDADDRVLAPKKEIKLVEEPELYKDELKYWSCVCMSLQDWIDLNERYKTSKKKLDHEISSLIEVNYLPEMPALFQKAEKERMQRLLALAPKRQSQRLQVKQQQMVNIESS
jgi:hypothetical protein